MGRATYDIYNVGFKVEYKPKWTSSTLSLTSTDFAQKIYWVNSNEDIKCDITGSFVEPDANDRYEQGGTHATKTKLLLYSRSICHYPITVTSENWSYLYPLIVKSIESERIEVYGKTGVRLSSTSAEIGRYPANGAQTANGNTYWYEIKTINSYNECYCKNDMNVWVKVSNESVFANTDFGWRPIEQWSVLRYASATYNYWTY